MFKKTFVVLTLILLFYCQNANAEGVEIRVLTNLPDSTKLRALAQEVNRHGMPPIPSLKYFEAGESVYFDWLPNGVEYKIEVLFPSRLTQTKYFTPTSKNSMQLLVFVDLNAVSEETERIDMKDALAIGRLIAEEDTFYTLGDLIAVLSLITGIE